MDQSDSRLGFPTVSVRNRVEELNRVGVEGSGTLRQAGNSSDS